ncbi:FluG domain-containing protein [Triangularia setosa]|uniref:FluG domain-containing protein n=1 Tax=Triangularia setosa TaxID=2587417 RepID=A0AAN6VXQ3_9PEZI|nr:FluG domain-containing protein [Podospora setosa]
MLSYIGIMRDPRASKDMVPDEVWELMPPDQQIAALKAERAQLKGGQYRIKAYREDYFYNRPTWDIDTDGQEEDEYVEPAIDLHIPERAQLTQILCNQPDNLSSAELLELRIQAAELMVVLCGKRETVKRNRTRRRAQANVTVSEKSPGPDPFPLLIDRNHPKCRGKALEFKYLNYFKNHVETVHGVRLRA